MNDEQYTYIMILFYFYLVFFFFIIIIYYYYYYYFFFCKSLTIYLCNTIRKFSHIIGNHAQR